MIINSAPSHTMSRGPSHTMSPYRATSCATSRATLCATVRSTVPGGLCWGCHARTARPRKARGAPLAPRGSQAAHAKNTGFRCNVSAQRSGSRPRQQKAPLFPRLGGPETTWHVSPTRGRSTAPRQRVCETAVLACFWHRCCRCDQKKSALSQAQNEVCFSLSRVWRISARMHSSKKFSFLHFWVRHSVTREACDVYGIAYTRESLNMLKYADQEIISRKIQSSQNPNAGTPPDRGSRIEDRESTIEDRGSRIEDRGSRIEDRGSRNK